MGQYSWYVLEEPEYTAECWDEVMKGREDASYTPAQACAYEARPIDKGMWIGLEDFAPDVMEMLKSMNIGLEPINRTLAWANENGFAQGGEWEAVALQYLRSYENRWTTWVTPEAHESITRAMLSLAGPAYTPTSTPPTPVPTFPPATPTPTPAAARNLAPNPSFENGAPFVARWTPQARGTDATFDWKL